MPGDERALHLPPPTTKRISGRRRGVVGDIRWKGVIFYITLSEGKGEREVYSSSIFTRDCYHLSLVREGGMWAHHRKKRRQRSFYSQGRRKREGTRAPPIHRGKNVLSLVPLEMGKRRKILRKEWEHYFIFHGRKGEKRGEFHSISNLLGGGAFFVPPKRFRLKEGEERSRQRIFF